MLVIRDEQMEAFRREALARFEARALGVAARQLDDTPLAANPSRPRQLVQAGLALAAEQGLLVEDQVLRLIACLARHGDAAFAPGGWAHGVLEDSTLSPNGKLARLEGGLAAPAVPA